MAVFDLRDGRVVHGPATMPQPAYEARAAGGLIEVRLRNTAQSATSAPASEASRTGDDDMEHEVGGLGI